MRNKCIKILVPFCFNTEMIMAKNVLILELSCIHLAGGLLMEFRAYLA